MILLYVRNLKANFLGSPLAKNHNDHGFPVKINKHESSFARVVAGKGVHKLVRARIWTGPDRRFQSGPWSTRNHDSGPPLWSGLNPKNKVAHMMVHLQPVEDAIDVVLTKSEHG